MTRGLNKVMIIGHLGRDPELRYTSAGKPVASFSVGVPRTWHDPEGARHEETEWFMVVSWGNLAEICHQHLRRGERVYIEGRMQTRRWRDEEGSDRSATELVAREMIRLGER